ncbi:MAG: hypothetical protein IJT12_10185 [Paludibacteraceae bacterium]|nr:hypothetical protein [Paludibacteraceae bacterium]
MKIHRITFLFIVTTLASCSHKYLPIVKTDRYYPPATTAQYVEQVPVSAVYIGTIKVVPRDYSFETRRDNETAIRNLQEAAAQAGANYIYVTYVTAPNKDYYYRFFNAVTEDFGEGFVVEAELYR